MNELTRKLRTLLHPWAAPITYAREDNSHHVYDGSYFIEVRDTDESGIVGEGRSVMAEFMNELVRGYFEGHSVILYGRVPSNLLWCDPCKGSEKYIWYNSPRKCMMFFKEAPKIENAEYHLPGIIYEAGGSHPNIYICKGREPMEKTELHIAPSFNVTRASVCLGSVRIEEPKDLTYADLLEYWERKFWLTEFSHLGAHGNPIKSDLVLTTRAAKDRPFDLEELRPLNNLKLKDILKRKEYIISTTT